MPKPRLRTAASANTEMRRPSKNAKAKPTWEKPVGRTDQPQYNPTSGTKKLMLAKGKRNRARAAREELKAKYAPKVEPKKAAPKKQETMLGRPVTMKAGANAKVGKVVKTTKLSQPATAVAKMGMKKKAIAKKAMSSVNLFKKK